jgi:tRNA threonylcarbamoyladenosine biosynthesis protein TsaB
MRILAMDTATSSCSVALWCDETIVAARREVMSRGQAEALVPMIGDVLAEAKVTASDLDLLAVTVGPGAFTGLRIGLATARGMGLAAHVPCLGLTTTEVIAHAVDATHGSRGPCWWRWIPSARTFMCRLFNRGLCP